MKSIATHQPNYVPWLGYFYKIYMSDFFVFLDDVQFSNQGTHSYHFIKTQNGPMRLRIPVDKSLGNRINKVKIKDGSDWRNRHLDLLYTNYSKANYFEEIYSDFSELLNNSFEYLSDLNISIIEAICKKLGIAFNYARSSDLEIESDKETRIIDICIVQGCNTYISGTGAKAYQNEENFIKNGIQLQYLEYKPVNYPQQFSGFQSNVTILDYLMNCGYNWDPIIKQQHET